jgi:hypothetical protein
LYQLIEPSGAKWCLYGVVKFRREINENCMLVGLCDPTSYGKGEKERKFSIFLNTFFSGPKGASCLLYRESFAGRIELPIQIEVGQLIRLHRMKVSHINIQEHSSSIFFN